MTTETSALPAETRHSALSTQHSAQPSALDARFAPVQLQLDGFEGPLEALLSLIEKRKLPITAVSLAAVADQYLAYVRSLPELDPDLLSDFLVVAAKLLLIKSRAILPGQDEPVDGAEEDPAEELAARLEAYRVIRAAAQYLQTLEQRGVRCYPHPPRPIEPQGPAPFQPIQPEELRDALKRLLQRHARTIVASAEIESVPRASVEARMTLILEALTQSASVTWERIAGRSVDEMVASFLAVLELVKRNLAVAEQEQLFGPIVLRRPSP